MCFISLVVITSALHAEGREFETRMEYFALFQIFLYYGPTFQLNPFYIVLEKKEIIIISHKISVTCTIVLFMSYFFWRNLLYFL